MYAAVLVLHEKHYHKDLTYLLTPWSRVLLEKLTGFAANQEIPHILWNPKVHYRTHKLQPPVITKALVCVNTHWLENVFISCIQINGKIR